MNRDQRKKPMCVSVACNTGLKSPWRDEICPPQKRYPLVESLVQMHLEDYADDGKTLQELTENYTIAVLAATSLLPNQHYATHDQVLTALAAYHNHTPSQTTDLRELKQSENGVEN